MRDPPGGGIVLGKGVVGELALENVAFYYPARPNQAVFESLSLSLPAGEMTALVGESGSGKSSVIQLLLRFYDPTAGRITLDGTDLRSISLTSLRGRIGLVGQEPVLFACTLAENLRYNAIPIFSSNTSLICHLHISGTASPMRRTRSLRLRATPRTRRASYPSSPRGWPRTRATGGGSCRAGRSSGATARAPCVPPFVFFLRFFF